MMKPSRFLPSVVLAALAVAALFHPIGSRAADDDAARRAAAEELLKTMHLEQLIGDTFDRMTKSLDTIGERATKQLGAGADQDALQAKIRTETHDMLRKEFSWDVLEPEFTQAYAEAFTESEIKDLIAFYKTPTGEKLIAKQPELSAKMAKFTQQRAGAAMPRIYQRIQELTQAAKAAAATPTPAGSTSPAASAAPGSSPVPAAIPTAPNFTPPAPNFTPPAPPATPAVHESGKSETGKD